MEPPTATMRHYRELTRQDVEVDRPMAWHLRTALSDALWRSEAGIALPDRRTPAAGIEAAGIDDLAARLRPPIADC